MKYRNSKNSGIKEVNWTDKVLTITFNNKAIYAYHKDRIGSRSFNKIIELTRKGHGLGRFINNKKATSVYGKQFYKIVA